MNSEGLLAPLRTGGRLAFVLAVLAVVSAVSALSFVLAVTRVMAIYHLPPITEQPPCPTSKPPFATCLAHCLNWHLSPALSSHMRLLKPSRQPEKVSHDLEMPYILQTALEENRRWISVAQLARTILQTRAASSAVD